MSGRPSLVASARLADAIGRETADLRVRLHEATLRCAAYRAAGRPDVAADVVAEQRALVADFARRLGPLLAGAAVEREAERVLAGTGELELLPDAGSDAWDEDEVLRDVATVQRLDGEAAPAHPDEPAATARRDGRHLHRMPVVVSALAAAAAAIAFVLTGPLPSPSQTLASAGTDQPDASGSDGAAADGHDSATLDRAGAGEVGQDAADEQAWLLERRRRAARPTADDPTRDVSDTLGDLQTLVGHLASGLPAEVLDLLGTTTTTAADRLGPVGADGLPLPLSDDATDVEARPDEGAEAPEASSQTGATAQTDAGTDDPSADTQGTDTAPPAGDDTTADEPDADQTDGDGAAADDVGANDPWHRDAAADGWLLRGDDVEGPTGW